MQEIERKSRNVKSREDFIIFMDYLMHDLKNNANTWENNNLDSYLEAIRNWVEDMDGFYENNNIPIPNEISWEIFSDILMAARIYE